MSVCATAPAPELDGRERRVYRAIADCMTIVRRGLTHLVITAVFLPLAVRKYQSLSR